MTNLLRRLRGLAALSLFAGLAWAVIGAAIGTAVLLIDPASVDAGEGPLWIAYYFGRSGLVAGAVAGIVLALAERRSSAGTLRFSRMAIWGAIGGLSIPWLAAGPQAMLPFFVALGAGTGALTWALARRGEQLAIGDRKDEPAQLA